KVVDTDALVRDILKPVNRSAPADLSSKPVYVVIWTTTPWTLPANQAVSLNPDESYIVVDLGSECLLLAEALMENALERYGIDKVDISLAGKCSGSALENI